MKKNNSLIVLFFILFIACVFFTYYHMQDNFSIVQEKDFPLSRMLNLCVEKNILDISSDNHDVVLMRTRDKIIAYNLRSNSRLWTNVISPQRDPYPAATNENSAYVSDRDQLWSYDLMSGKVLWQTKIENADTWIPDVSDQYVLLNSLSEYLYVFDARDGRLLWSIRVGRGYTKAFIDQDIVYVVDNGITAYKLTDGELLWNASNNRAVGEVTYFEDIFYFLEYPEDETFDLVAYDANKKMLLWKVSFIDEIANGLFVYDGNLYLSTIEGLYKIKVDDGEIVWQKKIPHSKGLFFLGKYIYALEKSKKTIYALDIVSGEEVSSLVVSSWGMFDILHQNINSTQSEILYSVGCHFFVFQQD